jgi:protein TonB
MKSKQPLIYFAATILSFNYFAFEAKSQSGSDARIAADTLPKKEATATINSEDFVFEKVDIEASVDMLKWRRHLEKHLLPYIIDAAKSNMKPGKYTVNVRFLVERDGRISDVVALNDPGYGLAKGAERVIKTGPKWQAGEQNGRKVRSYHTQPIIFFITEK